MKLVGKVVGIVVGFTLLFNPLLANVTSAGSNSNLQTFELDSETVGEFKVEENDNKRTVEYFENGIKTQISILDKETEEIYYYDLKQETSDNKLNLENNLLSENGRDTLPYTQKYHVNDFKLKNEISLNITGAMDEINLSSINLQASYSLVKSLYYDEGNQRFSRHLYGAESNKQYERNSWHFEAGIAFSIVILAVGFLPGVSTLIIGVVGVAGGAILSAATVQEWVKETYYKYQFIQNTPQYVSFYSPYEFVYKKQNKVEVNGDVGYWETFYNQSNAEIDAKRLHILQNPGLYM